MFYYLNQITHAIIICAGEGRGWKNYLGIQKHFIKIEDERLIDRTVRLINKLKNENVKVFVVALNDNYKIEGSTLFIPKINPVDDGVDKFLNSKELWSKQGRTIIFYGDVWFSEEAMRQIIQYDKKEWMLFARKGKSSVTGCMHEEIFAQSFYPKDTPEHEKNLLKIVEAYQLKLIRCGSGWHHYRCMVGLEHTDNKIIKDKIFNIDDFTDDFDYPLDYDTWMAHRNKKNWFIIQKYTILDVLEYIKKKLNYRKYGNKPTNEDEN